MKKKKIITAGKEIAHNVNIYTNYGRTTKIEKKFTYLCVILSLVFSVSMILIRREMF